MVVSAHGRQIITFQRKANCTASRPPNPQQAIPSASPYSQMLPPCAVICVLSIGSTGIRPQSIVSTRSIFRWSNAPCRPSSIQSVMAWPYPPRSRHNIYVISDLEPSQTGLDHNHLLPPPLLKHRRCILQSGAPHLISHKLFAKRLWPRLVEIVGAACAWTSRLSGSDLLHNMGTVCARGRKSFLGRRIHIHLAASSHGVGSKSELVRAQGPLRLV